MTDSVEKKDYLSMSDEEILAMNGPEVPAADPAPAPAEEPPQKTEEEPAAEKAAKEAEEAAAEAAANAEKPEDGNTGDSEANEDGADKAAVEVDEAGDKVPAEGDKEKAPEAKTEADEKPGEKDGLDYKAEYEKLLAPFKANGRDMSVTSVEEALTLMKMGANYNKKMAALKPHLRLLKMLENNNLLDEEKISYLVDLDKKSPEAINKLVKDSGLNPMDFDAEKAGEYKPKTQVVDDRELELDTVLEELQDSPMYPRVLSVVSKEWDSASKQTIANNPGMLRVITSHLESGVFDIVVAEMQRERVFGRLSGLSDIEAYRQVGDAINARGGFNHLGSSQGKTETQPVVVVPKPKKVEDDKLKEKRRAAGISSSAAAVPKQNNEFNPLSMSDAEFAKVAGSQFR